ncbi:hydantoinase/carbamoylase family amidase [Thermanaerosceptrum fracticalcis]|uniref:Hydantoinase/carbamoylase family amidase n=1 Tax=Thermanaerosceptrum fracticalcis TaxID=1712410 RepID=A0A7G6E391_THEFR|nr:Zn-dependent hydrolase [Thermanaerosceptrum fracticalcis]QNB46545.1 hydantoinase/carbamoylase family amidase [Thermanaerosceptrum fracticalcis]
MRVKIERIQQNLENLACFGKLEGGGVSRLAFTREDQEARVYLEKALESEGLTVKVDAFGNMRARRQGKENLAPVMIGSHLDSVPQGGRFDGTVGVVAALEVIRVLNELKVETRRPVELINFAVEESGRFGVGTLGSKAMCGHLSVEKLKSYRDNRGVSLYEALKNFGLNPEALDTVRINPGEIYAFIETHIEQGRVLEAENIPIGIVTAIAAPTRLKVLVKGRADHSGATPMSLREDALTAASEIILGVEKIAASEAGPHTVGTVGYVRVSPGAMNVIPGLVEMGIDLRDIEKDSKDLAVTKVLALLKRVSQKRHVGIEYEILANEPPVALSPKMVGSLEKAARSLGYSYKLMPSGAGHDAMYMAELTQVGMIFIPSKEGISHNPAEYSSWEEIARGAELLLETVINLANETNQ